MEIKYPYITDQMSNEEYHADRSALSRSQIKWMEYSPEHFLAHLNDVEPMKPTKALKMGDAFHCKVLEPDDFDGRFATMPEGLKKPTSAQIKAKDPSERTIEQISVWNEFEEETKGKTILTSDEMTELDWWSSSVLRNKRFYGLVKRGGLVENSIFWQDEETGIILKCRPDFLAKDAAYIIDLKTTECAREYEMQSSIRKYGYDVQAAMMFDACKALFGKEPESFVIAAVEKSKPFVPAIYNLDPAVLDIGRYKLRKYLGMIKHCQESDVWNGYGNGAEIIDISPAHWEMQQFEIGE